MLDITSYFQEYNFSASTYVELCDYKNINIDSNYIEVSDSDVVRVIEMDMVYYDCMKSVEFSTPKDDYYVLLNIVNQDSREARSLYYLVGSCDYGESFDAELLKTSINETFETEIDGIKSTITNIGIYEPATIDDEDMILSFYKKDSMEDVYEYIRENTKMNIVFNYMMDIILENTTIIDLPQTIKSQYNDNSASFWNDIIIYKAILEQEENELTEIEFIRAVEDAASDSGISTENVISEYSNSVFHFVLEEKLKEILVSYINVI